MTAPALPWMRVPFHVQPGTGETIASVQGLDTRLQEALLKGGGGNDAYTELFPIQTAVWEQLGGGLRTAHDLCIAAPTGSGKTLAYVLPVLNALAQRQPHATAHSLRALVVLPTRDLAQQVAAVMQPLCRALSLNLQLAAAQTSLAEEADAILSGSGAANSVLVTRGPGPMSLEMLTLPHASPLSAPEVLTDVLVATPGRLTAHLASTLGFSLRHLQFLVVDETDRLLRQSYQEWLPLVIQHVRSATHVSTQWQQTIATDTQPHNHNHSQPGQSEAQQSEGVVTASEGQGTQAAAAQVQGGWVQHGMPRCVKLIVSATLTRDPAKLQRLDLYCPRFVAVSSGPQRYQLPKSLQEYKILCSTARKPITVLALLKQLEGQSCVVFASSLDMTHRLYLLLKAVLDSEGANKVVECSGHKAAAAQRAAALQRFKSGSATVLVASDVVTRGMDFDGVQNVINYDAPVYVKTYVHRAGRTARAGRSGKVFTLLRDEDVRHFKAMLRKADNSYVKDYKLPPGAADAMAAGLTAALSQVSDLLASEAQEDAKAAVQAKKPKVA